MFFLPPAVGESRKIESVSALTRALGGLELKTTAPLRSNTSGLIYHRRPIPSRNYFPERVWRYVSLDELTDEL
jgi:hypothetical protein